MKVPFIDCHKSEVDIISLKPSLLTSGWVSSQLICLKLPGIVWAKFTSRVKTVYVNSKTKLEAAEVAQLVKVFLA